ncbi:MAG: DUF2721 domain-containing protein [Gemmataceae bacterium]
MLATINVHELIPILQVAVGPVILISGVGLLLLSMTNRFGRIVDRSRQLGEVRRNDTGEHRTRLEKQIAILMKRARVVRRAIVLATLSVLCAAILVITLFLAHVFVWAGSGYLVMTLFIACLTSLILSLLAFLHDINLSLVALKLELHHAE